jgi:hypothetical protein
MVMKMVQCLSCESTNVEVDGYNNRCVDCGVSWREPVYERSLYKNLGPSRFERLFVLVAERLPWVSVGGLFVIFLFYSAGLIHF